VSLARVTTVADAPDRDTWDGHFVPNLSPEQMIRAGIFGGVYWRRSELADYHELPGHWLEGLHPGMYCSPTWNASVNKYGVWAGSTQSAWDEAGWMRPQDPRGWVQWYCRYYMGRRSEDDVRQISRWRNFASLDQGRWSNILYGKIRKVNADPHDASVSPVIRQSLLHWGYEANDADYAEWRVRKNL